MLRRSRLLGICVAGLIAITASAANAASCASVEFADRASLGSGDLVLNGLGLRKATFLKIKVYVVGLYLPDKTSDANAVLKANQPWRLQLHFLRSVGASDMEDAFREGFKNTGADLSPLQQRIDALVGMFVDFKEGQTLTFSNIPEKGVAVELDKMAKGSVPGADFATTLLAIWLGREPANDEMKSGMLGGRCDW